MEQEQCSEVRAGDHVLLSSETRAVIRKRSRVLIQGVFLTAPPHYGLTGCPIKTQKCLKKCGMVPKSAE